MNQIVYIKCEMSKSVQNPDIKISDIASVFCEDEHIAARVKSIRVVKVDEKKSRRYVVSILKLIELIHSIYPGITVENEGSPDVVIDYRAKKGNSKVIEYIKLGFVCLITLIGGAFAVMSYNNDVGSNDLFFKLYELILGEGADGHLIMEISYSVGLAVGIIIFYGHFGNWKFGKDPTPLEVEMRLYEKDVDTALIKQSNREGVEIDVK